MTMNDDLTYASATELIALYRAGAVSPVEVLDRQLTRVEQVGVGLRTFTELLTDKAREQARASELRYRAGTPLPLDGITVALKEKHAIAGRVITEGSLAWDGVIPEVDHPVVERLRAAGAVLHARTATPEFSVAPFTHTPRWGVTRNPWNPSLSPGGSSGGGAAALAAGLTTLATASDIGGSTRGPASLTGTIGYKAPYGRVPGTGPMSLDYYRGDGPLARTVEDALLMTNIINGAHPRDHNSLPAITVAAGRSVAGLRIGYSFDLGTFAVAEEVIANTRNAVERLAQAGADLVEVTPAWTSNDLLQAFAGHFAEMMGAMVDQTIGSRRSQLSDYTKAYVEINDALRENHSMFDAVRAEYAVQQALAQAMHGLDALVCPTLAATGFPAGDSLAAGVDIDGQLVPSYDAMMTLPFNICNRCPVLAVPSGFASNGLPTGIQIVGQPYDDDTVFSIGRVLEDATGPLFATFRPASS